MTTMPYNKYSVLSHFMRFSETKMRNFLRMCQRNVTLLVYMHDILHQYVMCRIDIETLLQIHTHKQMRYFSLEFTPRVFSGCGGRGLLLPRARRTFHHRIYFSFKLYQKKKRTRRRCAVLSANCEHITFRRSYMVRGRNGVDAAAAVYGFYFYYYRGWNFST